MKRQISILKTLKEDLHSSSAQKILGSRVSSKVDDLNPKLISSLQQIYPSHLLQNSRVFLDDKTHQSVQNAHDFAFVMNQSSDNYFNI